MWQKQTSVSALYLSIKSFNSAELRGLRTNNAARASSPLWRRMNDRRASRFGSSYNQEGLERHVNMRNSNLGHLPSIRRLAISTTVSLIPLSDVLFFRAPISIASSASRRLSSSRSPLLTPSRGEAGGGDSHNRVNNTNTQGTSSVCFRTHTGAMIPSG